LSVVLILLVLVICTTGCPKSASVPPPAQDRPPVITLTSFPSGGGNTDPENVSNAAIVQVSNGTNVMVFGNAHNPGGVKQFELTVTQSGKTLYTVQAAAVPDSTGQVPDTLYILGSDGAGQAGSKVTLLFTEDGSPATTKVTATNFNGMTTTFDVAYACLYCGGVVSPPILGGTSPPKCGTGPACGTGNLCCNKHCVSSDSQNCGQCGLACQSGSTCQGQQCVSSGLPCGDVGASCAPNSQAGTHCCQTSGSPELCVFQICRKCIPHGAICPLNQSQLCCDAADQCVLATRR